MYVIENEQKEHGLILSYFVYEWFLFIFVVL